MRARKAFLLISIISLILLSAGLGFSQEEPAVENQAEPEIQGVWGEVVAVDIQNNELLIRCLDYETDSEKEMSITVDDKTIYENVASLFEIKAQDNVGIDYIINPEGKNIAKDISVEVEAVEDVEIPQEDMPQEAPEGEAVP
ncbi:MAG: hypothetical protein KKH29_03380 [Candidatus Omnitrophica bacterium]|nr:hypothetical protein [Candidatus Omnitrophota bacterium]MBU4346352.1 hypothetical protein [Candidatus Omnitrophota bacterium]MBU4473344.1 hypothetical protein [Candidatus Omnitrophota bacterium]MCG2705920.1 hypothetical protein [Candidatus Omnitrophota bacterium]